MDPFEAFLAERAPKDQWPLARAFRALVARVAPETRERMRGGTEAYYGVPVWKLKRDIIALSPSKTALTLSFSNGASFDDPYGLLGGAGNRSRTVRMTSMGDYNEAALAHYIRQAVVVDKR